jgi:hypothetical protein
MTDLDEIYVGTSILTDISNNMLSTIDTSNVIVSVNEDVELQKLIIDISKLDSFKSAQSTLTNDSIYDCEKIIYYPIDEQILTNILLLCDVHSHDTYTLDSLSKTLTMYIKCEIVKFKISSEMESKYRHLLTNYLVNIKNVVKSFAQNKITQIDEKIINILESTQFLYASFDLHEDNTQEHFINKLCNILLIIKNIIIIMVYWRKDTNSFTDILSLNLHFYETLIKDIVNPYILDGENYKRSFEECTPRILSSTVNERKRTPSTPAKDRGYNRNYSRINCKDDSDDNYGDHISEYTTQTRNDRNVTDDKKQTPLTSTKDITFNRINYKDDSYDAHDDHISEYTTHTRNDRNVNNITGDRKQITYDELTAMIGASYGNNPDMECSTALDIIALYLQGQKLLYIEAKNYSEQCLNTLMLPAITISVIVGLLALIFTSRTGFIIVACMSALNSLLLSLVSYLKLDAKAEAHKTTAYHFDKLETECSFLSGKILFFDGETENIAEVVLNIEKKIREIKEINQFILPDYVRARYPHTYGTNIFSVVKRLYIDETTLKNELKNTINAIIVKSRVKNKSSELLREIKALELLQDKLFNSIIQFKKKYLELDKPLKYEIEKNIRIKRMRYVGCYGILNKLTCGIANRCILINGPKRPTEYASDSTLEHGCNSV